MWRLHLFFFKHKTFILDRLKTTTIVILFLFTQQNFIGQNRFTKDNIFKIDNLINEIIYLNINNSTFITGENLNYKVSCLSKNELTTSNLTKVAYIELLNEKKQCLVKQKIFLIKGNGFGDIFLPTTLETGNYKLIAYTNWMLNFKSDFFQKDILIYNPYKKSDIKFTLENNYKQKDNQLEKSNNNLTFQVNKKKFSNRELVKINISASNEEFKNGNYILSIHKKDNLDLTNDEQNILNLTSNSYKELKEESLINLNLPEIRGEIISGKLISKNNISEVGNKNIALSIPGKSFAFKITKTDIKGNFNFIIDEPFTNPDLTFQIIDDNAKEYKIELTQQSKIDYSQISFPNNIIFNEKIKESIEERMVSSQIENAYYTQKKDSIFSFNYNRSFFENQSKEFILDDFTRFTTIKETIIEIIPRMHLKKENDSYSIYLDDYNNGNELPFPTLILIDGLYISDVNELIEYNPKNIQKINVIYGGYQFGTKLFNGIVSFSTKNFDFESKTKGDFLVKPELLRPLPLKNYYTPNYKIKKLDRIPDYRHQLLWEPNLILENATKEIEFFTSDLSGTFEILVEGISKTGTPVKIKDFFEVK